MRGSYKIYSHQMETPRRFQGPDCGRISAVINNSNCRDQNELQRIIKHNQKMGEIDIRVGTHYIWRTRKDDKVRSGHAEREGKIFSWKSPPPGGHPGEAFGCRCWPEPADVETMSGNKTGEMASDPENLSLSSKGAEYITSIEDLELQIYKDAVGKPTIGYGHLLKEGEEDKFKDGINKEQAIYLFNKDTAWAQEVIQKSVKVPLTQNQFDALTSLVFNVGGPQFENSKTLEKLNRGDYDGAAEEMLGFVYGTVRNNDGTIKKIKLDGLVKRRRHEYELFKR